MSVCVCVLAEMLIIIAAIIINLYICTLRLLCYVGLFCFVYIFHMLPARLSQLSCAAHELLYIITLHRMHEVRTIATDVPVAWCGVVSLMHACFIQERMDGSRSSLR